MFDCERNTLEPILFCSTQVLKDFRGHLFHWPPQNKMRWNDKAERQKLHFRCLISICQRQFSLVLSRFLPIHDATSRKPGVDPLNVRNIELILNTLIPPVILQMPFLLPILQNTPNLFHPFVIVFCSSSSFGSNGRECTPDQLL